MSFPCSVECNKDSDCTEKEECKGDNGHTCVGVRCFPTCGDHGYCWSIGDHEAECACDQGYHIQSNRASNLCGKHCSN